MPRALLRPSHAEASEWYREFASPERLNPRMAQLVLTTDALVMSDLTTDRPWATPRTDWAGVVIPSDLIETARTPPMVRSKPPMNSDFSTRLRRVRLFVFKSIEI